MTPPIRSLSHNPEVTDILLTPLLMTLLVPFLTTFFEVAYWLACPCLYMLLMTFWVSLDGEISFKSSGWVEDASTMLVRCCCCFWRRLFRAKRSCFLGYKTGSAASYLTYWMSPLLFKSASVMSSLSCSIVLCYFYSLGSCSCPINEEGFFDTWAD